MDGVEERRREKGSEGGRVRERKERRGLKRNKEEKSKENNGQQFSGTEVR